MQESGMEGASRHLNHMNRDLLFAGGIITLEGSLDLPHAGEQGPLVGVRRARMVNEYGVAALPLLALRALPL
jgi:hypothetical protein